MQVGETTGITEQENALAAHVNKGERTIGSSRNCLRVCADYERTTPSLWRSSPQGPKVMYVVFLGFLKRFNFMFTVLPVVFNIISMKIVPLQCLWYTLQ